MRATGPVCALSLSERVRVATLILCSHDHREKALFVLFPTRQRERARSRSWREESMAARLAPAQREEQSGTGACWCSMAIGPLFACVLVCVCGVVGCLCLCLSESSSPPPPRPFPTSSQTSYVQGNCQAATARTSRSVTNLPASPRHWRPGSRRKRIYLICSQKHSRAADLNGMRHQAR